MMSVHISQWLVSVLPHPSCFVLNAWYGCGDFLSVSSCMHFVCFEQPVEVRSTRQEICLMLPAVMQAPGKPSTTQSVSLCCECVCAVNMSQCVCVCVCMSESVC